MSRLNLAACLCIAGAIFLMSSHTVGWGWLLFIAFCALESDEGTSITIHQCDECGVCKLCEHNND